MNKEFKPYLAWDSISGGFVVVTNVLDKVDDEGYLLAEVKTISGGKEYERPLIDLARVDRTELNLALDWLDAKNEIIDLKKIKEVLIKRKTAEIPHMRPSGYLLWLRSI